MTKAVSSKVKLRRKKSGELARRLLEGLAHAAMWSAGERVGVGVSGGADSVALLLLLLELQEELGVVLSVVHLNHKLRGRASDADEKFVARLAAQHGLDFHVERVDVGARAKREKANLEDTARRARYEFFTRLVKEKKVDRVAVAHTADDQAETVLAHILRGTGLAGLGGIHPETDCVVRPLLHARRAELRAYLRSRKQSWREDATNRDTTRMRARIRSKLLPLLEKEFQPGVVAHLVSLAEFAREDEALLELFARERYEALVKKTKDAARASLTALLQPLNERKFNAADAEGTEKKKQGKVFNALTKRMLRRLIEETKLDKGNKGYSSTQITAQHVAAVLELARHGESGKTLQLPGGVEVRRERGELVFCSGLSRPATGKNATRELDYEYQIDFENGTAAIRLPQAGCVFRLRVIDWPTNRGETRDSGTVLDRDRLCSSLVLRNWRPGDRLQPTGHQKAHKLARLFNEKHISRWERRGWPVLTSEGTLVWARGFPIAAGFAAGNDTREGILIAEEKL